MRTCLLITLAVSTIALSPDHTVAETPAWNQWHSPQRDSLLSETEWPDALNGRLNLAWQRDHSPSYSGPIVQDGLVYTTETVDKTIEKVTAYDLESGELTWQVEWPGAMAVPFFAASNGDWIRSTPACSSQGLVVLGMRDVLVCLDPKTGNEKWRVDFPASMGTPLPAFGAVCSPLIDGDHVYVQTGGALVKLSMSDGRVAWTSLEDSSGMMTGGAFSSPVIATLAGQRQLVVQTRQKLCGVSLDDGTLMWGQPIDAFRGMNILTPLVAGDRIFTSAHSGRAQLFKVQKAGTNGWSIQELWSQKSQAYMSSPLLIGDSIYLHMKNQRVASLSLNDGSIQWTSSPFGKYWSMVSNGSQILALDNGGDLMLIEPSDQELVVRDRLKVASDSWAHLAVQGDRLIVRDLRALRVFDWK